MSYAIRMEPDTQVDLDRIDPADTVGLNKQDGNAAFEALGDELRALQELMYGASSHSMLVVLQGLDTSGKDGTIKNVFDFVNPQGCSVSSFKVPTAVELAHDFLWRCHAATPPKGTIGIFNRSHYEDVLVVRVHNIVSEKVWRRRYAHINNFEQLLADNNTIVVKFMLHISKQEQEERLLAREQAPEKAWKLAAGDWRERERWDSYIAAYEEALSRCSTEAAPWYVVPADKKWFRNLAVIETLVETLRPFKDDWVAALEEQGKAARAELDEYRASRSSV